MEIVVCLKRVPDTAARIQVAASGTTIDAANVAFTASPYDDYALEEGLRIKEATGAKLTVISLGPAEAAKELRDALAKGADQAVLLKADTTQADAWAVSGALAAAIGPLKPDLVLFGYKAADDDGAQVGSQVAVRLGLPIITELVEVGLEGQTVKGTRESAGGRERVECSLPACATVHKTHHEPRIANLKGIMAAKKKPLDERAVSLDPPTLRLVALRPPAERAAGRTVEGPGAVAEVVSYIKDQLKLI